MFSYFGLACNQCTDHLLKRLLHALANCLKIGPTYPWNLGMGDASYKTGLIFKEHDLQDNDNGMIKIPSKPLAYNHDL